MKKVLTILSLIFIFNLNLIASNFIEAKRIAYKSFLEENIPEELVEPFLERTFINGNVDIGLELLAVGKKESQWKRKVVGYNRDEEGNILSKDLGPLQLNSKNIKSFSKKYGISWEESNYNSDIYYMCICIDYYKDLRKRYSKKEAWMVYNGGESRIKRNCVRSIVKEYAETVDEYTNDFGNEWSTIVNKVKEDQIRESFNKLVKSLPYRKVTIKFQSISIPNSIRVPTVVWKEILYWYRREDFEI